MGARPSAWSACMARSCIVGMLSGRSLLFFLGMYCRRRGQGLYPRRLRLSAARIFCLSVGHITLSTPGVLAPRLVVTLRTASSLAAHECVSSHCKAVAWRCLLAHSWAAKLLAVRR